MSVSSLPEWKQLLLEKKRRDEEERERREKEEEEKLASMPAWKRGIIQRRKAKQDHFGDREKDICLLQTDVISSSDYLSDTDSSVTVNLGSDLSLSPDPGQWLDADPKLVSQVSMETIVPVHENPFIRTQCVWRKSRDSDAGNELEVKERDKQSPRGQDVDSTRGGDIELKRFRDINEKEKGRDRSQGRERENSREACEKDKNQRRESVKDAVKEQELFQVRKDTEEKETHSPSGPFSPLIPCLRTIRADNIIIIEQDRKGSDERRGRWREVERERPKEDQQGKRGMKMDLREILAGGGSVTEIRASEVLIIKPSVSPEERSAEGKGREDGEMKTTVDLRRESTGRELKTDMSWLREKEKERPWGQATVINKDDRKASLDDSVFVERGGRVSQLLSKFGEHPKPPSRSKSSDNFLQPGRRKFSGDQDDRQSEDWKADGKNMLVKNIPKRSFSFSDRVICAEENGLGNEGCYERKHSHRNVPTWVDVASIGRETTSKLKLGCARLLDKEHFGKHRDMKIEDEKGGSMQRRNEAETWKKNRSEVKKAEPVDKRPAEKVGDTDGDKGFTVASVKTIEGISFARRVPIRQDGKTRGEREVKRMTGEKSLENTNKDPEVREQTEEQVSDKVNVQREEGFENAIQPEASKVIAAPAEALSLSQAAESQTSYDSAFTECSSLLCTVTDRAAHRGPEWSGTGPQGPYLTHSVLSPQTEDLISKIEKVGDTTVYMNERGAKAHRAAHEMTKENKLELKTGSNSGSESLIHDTTPRSPKRIASIGIQPGPLEIQIPRTVFYVAEEMLERKKTEGGSSDRQDWEGGQRVERRDSWRIGKPLSRIESLREKIRQRELETLRQREAQGGDGSEAAETCDAQTSDDKHEEKGSGKDKEWEATAHMQKRPAEAERGREEAAQQTSITAFDVTREVDMLKTCPQLPVSVPDSKANRAEEVTSECATAATEVTSDSSQISEDEDGPLKHVEEKLRRPRGRHRNRQEEEDEEEKELSEEEVKEYSSSVDSVQSLSPSPPHPNSLAAMSRIYNLDTVGSRSGLYLRERAADISSTVHLVKVKPLISNSQQGDSKALSGDDSCGVQKVQRQIEQFQLKEQEGQKSCSSPNASLKDREIKGQQSPKGVLKHQRKDNEEKPVLNPKVTPQRVFSPTSQLKQTITINPSFLRSQSPDNSLKATNCAPTPASSPSSPSPSHSPSISPSPTPSPTLFSIRSASGGKGKRGATITITPKKPAAGGATGSTARPVTIGSTKAPSEQTTPTTAEPVKKKYPTAEEIEVIGGYQNLEKSCLIKNKGTPKKQANVCFDEDQLEQVCEYPSETCMLTLSLLPNDVGMMERPQGEDAQEDEGEVEGGTVIFKSTRSLGIATGPRLRVDESCPR